MTSRNKDQSDFDLDTFIDLFDEALASDDPRVKRTLQDLLIITALVRSSENHQQDLFERKGPLRRLFDDVHNLNRKLQEIENDKMFKDMINNKPNYGSYPISITPNIYPYSSQPSIFDSTAWSSLADQANIKPYVTAIKDSSSGDDC